MTIEAATLEADGESSSSQKPATAEPEWQWSLSSDLRIPEEPLRQLERHDWSLWFTAFAIMLVLAFGVYSYTIVPASAWASSLPGVQLKDFTVGLFGLVALFALFAVYKQRTVNRLRRQLANQMNLATALQTRTELFERLTILDPLTGLYNRRFANQHLAVELARCDRHNYKLTALMFDLNSLKQLNDRHSHLAGDAALRAFAAALRRAIRSSDVAFRLGGDEFLVLLPECEEVGIPRVLARMNEVHVKFGGEDIAVTFSAGWAEHVHGQSPQQLIALAERQLRQDKHTGSAGHQARAMQEQTDYAQRMEVMGRLTDSVAHDFNNLLTVIKGAADMAMHSLPPDHAAYPQVEQIAKAGERAANLTRQLLAFSRKQVLQSKTLNLGLVVTAMEMMLQRVLGKRAELVISTAPDLYPLCADASQMEQLIMNLIANARDAMVDSGRVLVEVSNFTIDAEFAAAHPGARRGPHLRLAVSDTGRGMDVDTQQRIFEPFFTTKETGKGTGLGLSIVYGIVKQNGGYIWVKSEPGQGTCVTVYLPRSAEESAPSPQPAEPAAAADGSGPGVLVVESFEGLRKLMCDFLRGNGYRTYEASNGEQAIDLMDQHKRIQLLICDFALPGMSGLELSECLAQHRNLQVLYIAGYVEDTLLVRECVPDPSHVLSAPFTAENLAAKVTALLQEKPTRLSPRETGTSTWVQ